MAKQDGKDIPMNYSKDRQCNGQTRWKRYTNELIKGQTMQWPNKMEKQTSNDLQNTLYTKIKYLATRTLQIQVFHQQRLMKAFFKISNGSETQDAIYYRSFPKETCHTGLKMQMIHHMPYYRLKYIMIYVMFY